MILGIKKRKKRKKLEGTGSCCNKSVYEKLVKSYIACRGKKIIEYCLNKKDTLVPKYEFIETFTIRSLF